MCGDGVYFSGGKLEPETILQCQHPDIREDFALAGGEEAVDRLAGCHAQNVAGHETVEKTLAIFADQLEAADRRTVEQPGAGTEPPYLVLPVAVVLDRLGFSPTAKGGASLLMEKVQRTGAQCGGFRIHSRHGA